MCQCYHTGLGQCDNTVQACNHRTSRLSTGPRSHRRSALPGRPRALATRLQAIDRVRGRSACRRTARSARRTLGPNRLGEANPNAGVGNLAILDEPRRGQASQRPAEKRGKNTAARRAHLHEVFRQHISSRHIWTFTKENVYQQGFLSRCTFSQQRGYMLCPVNTSGRHQVLGARLLRGTATGKISLITSSLLGPSPTRSSGSI